MIKYKIPQKIDWSWGSIDISVDFLPISGINSYPLVFEDLNTEIVKLVHIG